MIIHILRGTYYSNMAAVRTYDLLFAVSEAVELWQVETCDLFIMKSSKVVLYANTFC
jgi:hypothetical protein